MLHVESGDGRQLAGRLWSAEKGSELLLLLLHGVMSHSGWFHLLGPELAARGVTLLAPDRRGAGASIPPPGDAVSAAVLRDDLDRWLDLARGLGKRVHLGGFCWGSNYAGHYLAHRDLAHRRVDVESLVLIAPGVFPTARVLAEPQETGESAEPTVEVPLRLEDFTRGPLLEGYLRRDPLRCEKVSPRFVAIERHMAALLPVQLARVDLPVLVVVAEHDEVSDNQKMKQLFDRHLAKHGRWAALPTAHGVIFEAPAELAEIVAGWVGTA